MNIKKGKESVLFATKIFQMKGRIKNLNNEERKNILEKALMHYYDLKIKDLSREEIDIFKANDLYEAYRETREWLLRWYTELDPQGISPTDKKEGIQK